MGEVFIIPFHVHGMEKSIMPGDVKGAYVTCYALTQSYEDAIGSCVAALREDGLKIEEVLQPISSMDMSQWAQHVLDQWPDHASLLPSQDEFENSMVNGRVVYGPFGSY